MFRYIFYQTVFTICTLHAKMTWLITCRPILAVSINEFRENSKLAFLNVCFVRIFDFPYANGPYDIIVVCTGDTNGVCYLTTNGYISGQIRFYVTRQTVYFMILKVHTYSNGFHIQGRYARFIKKTQYCKKIAV